MSERPNRAVRPATSALAYGLVAAAACAAITWAFAALLSFSAGLVVVALFTGRIVGLSVRTGGRDVPTRGDARTGGREVPTGGHGVPTRGDGTRSGGRDGIAPASATSLAVLLTLAALTIAFVATWVFARATGGVLGLPDYLLETLGPIVPLSYIVATLAAWWSTR